VNTTLRSLTIWEADSIRVGGLLATSGEWSAYHVTILFAGLLLVQGLLLPETLYPRAVVVRAESLESAGNLDTTNLTILRTKDLGYLVSCFTSGGSTLTHL
jgi:hypothetical protein